MLTPTITTGIFRPGRSHATTLPEATYNEAGRPPQGRPALHHHLACSNASVFPSNNLLFIPSDIVAGNSMVNDFVGAGKTITTNGRHQAVRVGDTVFDNFFPNGVPYDWYVDALHAPAGISINSVPF